MKVKNAMQLKARINSRAKEAGILPQALMQNYLMEGPSRFLVGSTERRLGKT